VTDGDNENFETDRSNRNAVGIYRHNITGLSVPINRNYVWFHNERLHGYTLQSDLNGSGVTQ
jgi:hypothetical protein